MGSPDSKSLERHKPTKRYKKCTSNVWHVGNRFGRNLVQILPVDRLSAGQQMELQNGIKLPNYLSVEQSFQPIFGGSMSVKILQVVFTFPLQPCDALGCVASWQDRGPYVAWPGGFDRSASRRGAWQLCPKHDLLEIAQQVAPHQPPQRNNMIQKKRKISSINLWHSQLPQRLILSRTARCLFSGGSFLAN